MLSFLNNINIFFSKCFHEEHVVTGVGDVRGLHGVTICHLQQFLRWFSLRNSLNSRGHFIRF